MELYIYILLLLLLSQLRRRPELQSINETQQAKPQGQTTKPASDR